MKHVSKWKSLQTYVSLNMVGISAHHHYVGNLLMCHPRSNCIAGGSACYLHELLIVWLQVQATRKLRRVAEAGAAEVRAQGERAAAAARTAQAEASRARAAEAARDQAEARAQAAEDAQARAEAAGIQVEVCHTPSSNMFTSCLPI